ncbi:hypothetical protein BCV53_00355 [Parageobacillus thermoglucosidasius]|uniref:Uncharacterized protein n=2 Tax=Anoxybacillaceae TaxID=3120669 RepID=A0AAN0YKR4_PARTM|nr:hypothetical protein Geoth_0572 [Parageobacillus thermoglucosidasius C56-YS93]ALF08618.1 hypothetical protein AOT13_00350 [Parageobacillus thermoglucosidasius]EID45620.1 hypothetical protein GT20_0490 [Parageobacillus thermoglucosidasius TNO-09.020]KYD13508.1 hypothetical protein B4168_3310 [Anoxybacillus flavithermus]ANZ28702.1 hypothetical protein BCV53_00355 [Parageobacillus thermoglucosidasius]
MLAVSETVASAKKCLHERMPEHEMKASLSGSFFVIFIDMLDKKFFHYVYSDILYKRLLILFICYKIVMRIK